MTSAATRLTVLTATVAVAATGLTLAAASSGAETTHAVPRCTNGSLTVTRTFVQGAAGTSGFSLIYRNRTTSSCSVSGYPGLDAITRTGHVLAHAKRNTAGTTPRTVVVRPGGFASAAVRWHDVASGSGRACRTSAAVSTIVANTTRAHRVAVPVGTCGLQVLPSVAGLPGYPRYAQAQFDWISASQVDAAGMNMYFDDAAGQLKAARLYPDAYRQLRQLASFPLTGLTAKQAKQARADAAALDTFFATPGLFR